MVCDRLGNHIFLHVPSVGQEKHDLAHENGHSVFMKVRYVVTLHKNASVGVVVVLQLKVKLHFVEPKVDRWEVDQSQQKRIVVADETREQVKQVERVVLSQLPGRTGSRNHASERQLNGDQGN